MSGPPEGVDTSGSSSPPSQGYVDPDFPNPGGDWDVPVIIYGYTPSFVLAVLAAVLFFISFCIHLFQTLRYRTWWFATVTISLVFEVAGYIARCLSAEKDPYHLLYFIIQYFFIVTAPVFLAAGIYAVLSVLMNRIGRQYSPIAPKLVLAIFITSDVVATVTQIAGASLIGVKQSKREDPTTANNILLGGLAYQVFAMGVFCILAGIFLFRARHELKARRLIAFTSAFVAATLLVYLRTCFRLAETAEGLGGNLYSHEVYFGVLEFAPIVLAVYLFNGFHPGRCIGGKRLASNPDAEK
ncbi:Sphingoid long-chain base transporter RSB1-like protein 7 [Zalerion maritima]|uniref:Sphingoid long-chain base transporter RSB1-like protein 7 n=1 Tax=Zalerion maritima TaxID=339359 RepID=A0AAD5RS00_9PEZI|nr:Sphingoid long-chain base transporter RSB1-like protein 7 [Zalerion maritima]